MHDKIDQKYNELRMTIEQFHTLIELKKDHWKIELANRMEVNIGYVLMEQLQKDEVDGVEVNKARDEFFRITHLYNLLNNHSLIDVINEEDNPVDLKAPRLIFPNVDIDGFTWFGEISTKNNVQKMECSDQEQIHLEENTTYQETDCEYYLY
ncbi:unnamed protein product [Rotaria sp. Silwood1]|nr:unnamed protein product [Rotaria sp. Silwood1]CAF5140830.1 unnamed protein product [Rotaria sp. Silwood1]